MEETDFLVNKTFQYGIQAVSPQEALNKVMAGEGIELSVTYSAQPRPQRAATAMTQTGGVTGAAAKLEKK